MVKGSRKPGAALQPYGFEGLFLFPGKRKVLQIRADNNNGMTTHAMGRVH
jgi:hypothetical protein